MNYQSLIETCPGFLWFLHTSLRYVHPLEDIDIFSGYNCLPDGTRTTTRQTKQVSMIGGMGGTAYGLKGASSGGNTATVLPLAITRELRTVQLESRRQQWRSVLTFMCTAIVCTLTHNTVMDYNR